MEEIEFYCEDISYTLGEEEATKSWLLSVAKAENRTIEELSYIFCSDEYLLEMNKVHLDHDYFTDIITFDNSFEENDIMGDVYISVDRVKENATSYEVSFDQEMNRVLVHGLTSSVRIQRQD